MIGYGSVDSNNHLLIGAWSGTRPSPLGYKPPRTIETTDVKIRADPRKEVFSLLYERKRNNRI